MIADIPPAFVCHVARFADGDTWTCANGVRVRLARTDAPETHGCPRRRCAPGDGKASKAALIRFIGGRTMLCQPVPWKDGARSAYDRFGRLVAACSVAGRGDVGAYMIAGGWAVRWP